MQIGGAEARPPSNSSFTAFVSSPRRSQPLSVMGALALVNGEEVQCHIGLADNNRQFYAVMNVVLSGQKSCRTCGCDTRCAMLRLPETVPDREPPDPNRHESIRRT